MTEPVGRFAPTPSGRMHLGNALCCLLSWLSAKARGGRVVLRIENLDEMRAPRPYTLLLEEDLRWLGLAWDEGGHDGPGPHGPYEQSRRSELYAQSLSVLESQGLIYPCFCSRAQLHAAAAPHQSDGIYVYSGRCRDLTPEQVRDMSRRRPPALRCRMPETTMAWEDLLQGPQRWPVAKECGDVILRRSDGVFAYQLAVVVDDALMGVNQVVRGRDLLSSTPVQLALYQALGYAPPEFGHIPLLLAPDGRRLSKRDGDLDLGALRARGVPAERIVGALAHAAGLIDRPEPTTPAELIREFSWSKVPKGDIKLAFR